MKILIVDDQEESRYLLASVLKGAGHEVGSAPNGKEALEALQGSDYQMVISDILMPVMDGFQLCHRVKADDILKHTAFVFYTATYIESEDENLAQKLGADRFIRKPLEPQKLIEIINQLIRQKEKGEDKTLEKAPGNEKEVFKLYNQRLINKLEEKMLSLEKEVSKRRQAEEELKLYYSQLEALVEERTAELTQTNRRLEQEIAERKKTDEALKKARDQLEVLVEERTFELSKANRQLRKEIDGHKQTQEALIKEKEKAQQYLDIAGVIMMVINRDQTVGLVNKKGCEILGYKCEDIIGKNWFDQFLPERERDRVKNTFSLLIQGQVESVEDFENPVLTKDGEERVIAWHNALIKDEQGKILGTLSSGQDITGRKPAAP